MKLSLKQQSELNKLTQLFDSSYRNDKQTFKFSGTTPEHSRRVYDVCEALNYDIKTIFYCEPIFKNSKYRPDIFCPFYLGGVFIEIRHSETDKLSNAKLQSIPFELKHFKTIYIDTNKKFELKDIQ